jgi:hypothetical protein
VKVETGAQDADARLSPSTMLGAPWCRWAMARSWSPALSRCGSGRQRAHLAERLFTLDEYDDRDRSVGGLLERAELGIEDVEGLCPARIDARSSAICKTS